VKLLLDTCTTLWIALGASDLSKAALEAYRDPENVCYLSAASAWEIGIKHALGRLALPDEPLRFLPELRATYRLEPLPLDEESCLQAARLPALHRDPFDRALVGQAITHGLTIMTPDTAITAYPVRTLW
jgi:PIN domain nuclease of toxin-antitoxin system